MKRILIIGNFPSTHSKTRSSSEDLADRLEKQSYKITRASHLRNTIFKVAHMVFAILCKRKDYDVAVIDVFSGRAFMWADLAAKILKKLQKPHVLVLRGGALPKYTKENQKKVELCLNRAEAVVAPSRYLYSYAQSYRDSVHLIPNAINLKDYQYALRDKVSMKIIWVRAFHEIYHPELAVKVAGHLAGDRVNINISMVGPNMKDGSYEKTQKLINDMKLEKSVITSDGVKKEEISKTMNQGDIFINTSRIDNTPVTVIEAMACGLCVVSTNVGGISYLLEHEKDSLLVPPNDPEAMASAIQRLREEPGLAAKISRNARKKAEEFDWDKIIPQWERLLSSLHA